MEWQRIRAMHGDRWLVIEALQAHSAAGYRHLADLAVIEVADDPRWAMERYLTLHREAPCRELYVLHSSREHVVIEERRAMPLRGSATAAELSEGLTA